MEVLKPQVESIFGEIKYITEILESGHNTSLESLLIARLSSRLNTLEGLLNELLQMGSEMEVKSVFKNVQEPEFAKAGLAEFNGLNGKPAYVAVDGTVYDVTGNAAWAAATHFGLHAGQELTGEFNMCHPMQGEKLKVLPVVGRLADTNAGQL